MRQHNLSCAVLAFALLYLTSSGWCQNAAATPSQTPDIVQVRGITAIRPLSNGLEAKSDRATLRITAIRENILRIQISTGDISANHSWAVLPAMITNSVAVNAIPDSDHLQPSDVGFNTGQLKVTVNRDSGRIVISDSAGSVISQDHASRPTTFFGEEFKVYKTAFTDEHFYGLGDKPGSLDRRNHAYQLWTTDAYGWEESRDPIYKAIPFFISVRNDGTSYGILLDNTFRSSFDFTTELREGVSFGAEGGDLDYYFIYGPGPKDVLSGYADLTGHSPLPPRWALGFQQSRWSYESESRVREIAGRFRQKQIPLDVIYLDIDYQIKNRPFTINDEAFPTFNQMVQDLKGKGIHVIAITDLHIADLPNANYEPYDSGVAGDHFVHNPDGSLFVGEVWPGPSVFPEFTRASTRKWWGNLYKNFYTERGVDGFWNDMNEPIIFEQPNATMPLETRHRIDDVDQPKRTTTHREVHNIFGMENSRATYEGLLVLKPNNRPFVLTRASFAGGQRYAATWTGDNAATWNHLRISTPQLLNLGLSGFAFSGDDIGGFRGSPMPDLLTRWIELGAFNPIYRDHTEKGTADQEPWAHGLQQEAIRKQYIELRYRLMPYIYTVAEETSRSGIPMMRPVFLEFPKAEQQHISSGQADSEFFFGSSLLVAPQQEELLDAYQAGLPVGSWYDYWTGQMLPPGPSIKIAPKLDVLPVFVRAGAMIPQQPVVQSTSEIPNGPLELRVYPGPNCSGSLYTDDGVTFDYQRGAYLRETYSCEVTDRGLRVRIAPHQGSFHPWWKQVELQIAGYPGLPKEIRVNGRPYGSAAQLRSGQLCVTLDDLTSGSDVEIVNH